MARAKDTLIDALHERQRFLRNHRSTFESLWSSIATYVIPRRQTFNETDPAAGLERNRQVLDSTAPRALELFASFIHNLLNNPATQWIMLTSGDPEVDRKPVVKKWLEKHQKRLMRKIAAPDSSIYTNFHEVYLDIGAFGTSVFFLERKGKTFKSRTFHLADVDIAEGEDGSIDELHRSIPMTIRNIRQRWPDAELPNKVAKMKEHEKFIVIHSVFPVKNEAFQLMDESDKRAAEIAGAGWASVWFVPEWQTRMQTGHVVRFPYMVPRWYKERRETWGRSPAMTVMPDIRMANRMKETILRGAEKLVDPPLLMPDGQLLSPVRLFPGALTYTDGVVDPKPLIPPGASRIEVGDALLKDTQQAIRDGFFVPLFVTPENPVKTATQVLQEVDERNRAVSPMLVRLQNELFHTFVLRSFELMDEMGEVDPMPNELKETGVTPKYLSPLAASMRQFDGLALLRFFEQSAPLAAVAPEMIDHINTDAAVKVLANSNSVPSEVLNSDATVRRIRDARKEQADARQQAAIVQGGGELAAKAKTAEAALIKANRS